MTTTKPVIQQVEVQVMGQSYILACPEGGQVALIQAVERVDAAMCRIRDAGKVKARERIAVLASLNLAFELVQMSTNSIGAAELPAAHQQFDSNDFVVTRFTALIARLDQALDADDQLI